MTVEIIDIQRNDQTLDVIVLYDDGKNWQYKRVYNFQDASSITADEIIKTISDVATIYKAAISNEESLKALIGTKYTI